MSDAQTCDLLVVGAGPAGLAAATLAADLGLDCLLVDEQPTPGGQIYRAVTTTPLQDRHVLGEDYWRGAALVETFRRCGARYQPGATVWAIAAPEPDATPGGPCEVVYSVGGRARRVLARRVILATGAQERPFPIPGWTLPGVMSAGAAQILLKTSGIAAEGRTVLAGGGPLLYLLAWQYLNAGVAIDCILETVPPRRIMQAAAHLPGFVSSAYFAKGLALLDKVRRAVEIVRGVRALQAVGLERLQAVSYRRLGGAIRTVEADQLLLHQGVIPGVNLSRALALDHVWNPLLACWQPAVDVWGATSREDIAIAGDGAGIAGARAAEHRGRLTALDAACRLGHMDRARRDRDARPHRRALQRELRGRAFFDRLYLPPEALRRPDGDTIVCRCEEVEAAQVREAAKLGCQGPNQAKAFLRCGMGPCQGRLCGATVAELISEERGVPTPEAGYYRLRFPTKPVTLGEFAALPSTPQAQQAVVRIKK